MSRVRFCVLFIFAGGFLACTEGTLETSRLADLKPIMFKGSIKGSQTTNQHTSFIPSSATCDKTVTSIQLAASPTGPFTSLNSAQSGVTLESCRKSGRLSIDVLAAQVVTFTQGKSETKTIYFRAVSGNFTSEVSQLDVTYKAPIVVSGAPGMSLSLASGQQNFSAPDTGAQVRFSLGRTAASVVRSASGDARIEFNQ